MHEEKQRLLEEMLRANSNDDPSSTVDSVPAVDAEPDTSVCTVGGVSVPIVLLSRKRKPEDSDDAVCQSDPRIGIVYNAKCGQGSCCLTTDVDAECVRQLVSDSSVQHLAYDSSLKPVTARTVSSGFLCRSPPDLSSVVTSRRSMSSSAEEPFRFACKLCSFKCRYDFSYIAHLNQHDKLKELEIDDLQSHLVASTTQSDSHIPNKIAIKLISTDSGDVSYVEGHTELVDSSGISYILLCPGAVDQAPLMISNLSKQQPCENVDINNPSVIAGSGDCVTSNVVPVDDVNAIVEQVLDSATRTSSTGDDVDFTVGPDIQFLDTTSGETMYVINESSDFQVALPTSSSVEHQKNTGCEETEVEVVLSPQPGDGQLLDVVSLCSSEDECEAEDSFTCYYCNETFTNMSQLQQHILQLHVD